MQKRILVVEDADTLREVLASVLTSEGYEVTTAASAEEAIPLAEKGAFHCVLSDFKLPKKNGIELLQIVREKDKEVPYVIMTAFGSIEIATEAMKCGANDFMTKPFEPEHLVSVIQEVIDHRQVINRSLGKDTRRGRKFLTNDEITQKVLDQAKRIAGVTTSVLLLGESGTGKELIARYIHEESPRHDKPFIAVNCAAMPATLLESEFFGHQEGAFTGATQTRIGVLELASEGTIFLDEVGDMPPELQVKLLRALQEGEIKRVGGSKTINVQPRIIAATNIDVEEALDSGKLRDDFYYRIAVVSLEIPPLRERPEDVKNLIQYFLSFFASTIGREAPTISREAYAVLQKYPWPGNARELENVMERAVILAKEEIYPEHLGLSLSIDYGALQEAAFTLPEIAQQAMQRAEVEVISKVLRQTQGNKSQASRILGVSYKTLLNKIRDYELDGPESRA